MLRKRDKNYKVEINNNFGGIQNVVHNETTSIAEVPLQGAGENKIEQPPSDKDFIRKLLLVIIPALITAAAVIIAAIINANSKSTTISTQNTSITALSEYASTTITTEETQTETTTEPTEEITTTVQVYRYITYTDSEAEGRDKGWKPYNTFNGTNTERIKAGFGENRTTTEKPGESEDLRIVDTTPVTAKEYTYSAASPGAGWELVDSTWYFDGQPVAYDHELQSAPNIRFDHKESVAYKYKIVTRQFNDSGEELEPVSETTGWLDHPMETSDRVTLVDQQFKWYYLHGTQKYVKTTTTGTIYTYQVMQYKTIYWWIIESFEPIAETDKIKPYDGN